MVRHALLKTIAGAGLLAVAVAAPSALKMFQSFGITPHRRQREVVRNAQRRLVAQGLLARNAAGFLRLTAKGEEELRRLEWNRFENFRKERPGRWDKKWRLLIFDIPDKRKQTREWVRRTLVNIGFASLQQSVFAYPYDCEDLIALLKADFKIGNDLLYIIADAVENDRSLREYFDLPNE